MAGGSIYEPVASDEEDDGAAAAIALTRSTERRLLTAMVLNLLYTFAELGIYYTYDSLAMLADGFHNLSDVMAIVIAWYCEKVRPLHPAHAARQ